MSAFAFVASVGCSGEREREADRGIDPSPRLETSNPPGACNVGGGNRLGVPLLLLHMDLFDDADETGDRESNSTP